MFDSLGAEIYSSIPRGWYWVTLGQLVAITGLLLVMAGLAIAFLYKREMTWALASLAALLFTSLMIVLFGVIPNEWLTLTQSEFEWTPQKIAFTIPSWLVLNNEVSISFSAIKDIVSGTYSIVALGGVVVGAYMWQVRQKNADAGPPPQPISTYGRPMVTSKSEG